MCLTVPIDQFKILTATDDIIVYKMVRFDLREDKMYSYFENYLYSLTDVMVAHTFSMNFEPVDWWLHERIKMGDYRFDYGFHSFVSEAGVFAKNFGWCSYLSSIEIRLGRFIVPKGSQYILGKFNGVDNILSEKLKFLDFI